MSGFKPPPLPDGAAEALEALQATSGDRDAAAELADSRVVRWRDLDDWAQPEEIADAWNDLAEFVDWLVTRYRLPTSLIPYCWYRHGNLVEELSALNSTWKAAFDDADSGYGPIGFQERLHQARERFKAHYANECATNHVPWPGRAADRLEEERRANDLAEWVMEARGELA